MKGISEGKASKVCKNLAWEASLGTLALNSKRWYCSMTARCGCEHEETLQVLEKVN